MALTALGEAVDRGAERAREYPGALLQTSYRRDVLGVSASALTALARKGYVRLHPAQYGQASYSLTVMGRNALRNSASSSN